MDSQIGGVDRAGPLPVIMNVLQGHVPVPMLHSFIDESGLLDVPVSRTVEHHLTMLVSRGAVYAKDTAEFRAHDHCRCFGTPVFNDSQIPDESKRLSEEWAEVTKGTQGPKEAQEAWKDHSRPRPEAPAVAEAARYQGLYWLAGHPIRGRSQETYS